MSEIDCGLHDKQIDFLFDGRRIKTGVFGRGWGKSYLTAAIFYQWMCQMPRGKAFLTAGSYEQIENTTLAECRKFWEALGLIEDVHYVVGKQPPRYLEEIDLMQT